MYTDPCAYELIKVYDAVQNFFAVRKSVFDEPLDHWRCHICGLPSTFLIGTKSCDKYKGYVYAPEHNVTLLSKGTVVCLSLCTVASNSCSS